MRDTALWARLQAYGFPMTDGCSLAGQIATQTSLSDARADLVVGEYRRFIYLAAAGGGTLAPSPLIDRVWHHHLMDTKAYLTAFCPEVLGKTLHHIPGRPPASKDVAYLVTLEQYRAEFGAEPPKQIWPTPRMMQNARAARTFAKWLGLAAFGFAFAHMLEVTFILLIGAVILTVVASAQGGWSFGGPFDGGSGCGGGDSSDSDGCGGGCGGGD